LIKSLASALVLVKIIVLLSGLYFSISLVTVLWRYSGRTSKAKWSTVYEVLTSWSLMRLIFTTFSK
jgi:hypothetical protein